MAEKKITTETLARMVQKEFIAVNGRLVNVEMGIRGLREELHLEIGALREDMKAGFEMLNKTLEKGFRIFGGEIVEIKEREKEQKHEDRIRHLELKIGIKR